MGVLLTAALIVAGTAIGVGAERRRPAEAVALARRLLKFLLWFAVPVVVFFNLAHASISLDNGVGLLLGLVTMVLVGTIAWFFRRPGAGSSRARRPARSSSPRRWSNTAYLGYPLTVALLGHDHLSTGVLFDVLVAGPTLMLGAFAVGGGVRGPGGRRSEVSVGRRS